MNIKPEIVRTLLDTLVTPQFDDIVRYDIIARQNDEGKTGVGIDVIMKHRIIMLKGEEYKIERRIRDVMKYLSPAFVMVEFYNTTDY
jgi:predicted thioesterase